MKKNRFEGKTCYMCDAPAMSDEHAPPKCLFPEQKDLNPREDYRKNLIKVPSCFEHNSEKSGDDLYLLYALSAVITSNRVAENHFLTKVKRGIERNPSLLLRLVNNSTQILLENRLRGTAGKTIAFNLEKDRFEKSVESIGRAIYFAHFKEKWLGKIEATPHFMVSFDKQIGNEVNEYIRLIDLVTKNLFEKSIHYGHNSKVFTYQLLPKDGPIHVIMLFSFYENSRITLLFKE